MIRLGDLALILISYILTTVLERSSKNLASGMLCVGGVRSGANLYQCARYYWPNVVLSENSLWSLRLAGNVSVGNS